MIWMDVDAALGEVPVNAVPLIDDTDFKSIEASVAYNAAGLALYWHFVAPDGTYTVTQVTPTTGGVYDWAHQAQGLYTIEIPASGGASINNNTEGFGWFTGVATGVLPWRGPTIGFRAAGLNDLLVESAHSATRGLAGTALPAAAADAAGGLPVSDAGGLDLDAERADVAAILVDTGTTLDGRIPAGLVGGRMDSSVGAMATDTLTAAALKADAVTEIQAGLALEATAQAVKAKTDNLPADPADASDVAASFASIASTLATIASYIDTEVAAIKAKTDLIPGSPAAVGSAMTLTSGERDAVAAALLDLAAGIETGLTPRQAIRLALAALAGKLSGAGTETEVFRNAVADSKARITATVDAAGNRTAITTDVA